MARELSSEVPGGTDAESGSEDRGALPFSWVSTLVGWGQPPLSQGSADMGGGLRRGCSGWHGSFMEPLLSLLDSPAEEIFLLFPMMSTARPLDR